MKKQLANLFVYSNLWVALCAAALSAESFLVNGHAIGSHIDYILAVFFGTWSLYIIHRRIGMSQIRLFNRSVEAKNDLSTNTLSIGQRINFIQKYKRVFDFLAIGFALLAGYFIFPYLKDIWLLLLISVILGLAYVVPTLPGNKRVRDLPFIKILLIAITWTLTTCLIPIEIVQSQTNASTLAIGLERICFILLITLPFDYRDKTIDAQYGLKTFAHLFNKKQLARAMAFLAILGIGLIFLLAQAEPEIYAFQLRNYFFAYIIALIIAWQSLTPRNEIWYSALVEGTMISRFFVFFIGNWINV